MFNVSYILIAGSVAVIALGQVIFKFAAQHIVTDAGRTWSEKLSLNLLPIGLVSLALVLYLISTFAWVQALRTVPLSVAFMFNSLAFIIVPCAGFFFFSEPVPPYFLLGATLIVGGILAISIG